MKSTTFNAETLLYLTIPNLETHEDSAWYIFIPILGCLTDPVLLAELVNYATCIEDPEEELKQRGDAVGRHGGLWIEILTPLRCSRSDVVLRLFGGLKSLQAYVGDGENGGTLVLAQSPVFGVEDFSERFPHMVRQDL